MSSSIARTLALAVWALAVCALALAQPAVTAPLRTSATAKRIQIANTSAITALSLTEQTRGTGTVHPTTGDTCTLTYATGGQSFTRSGSV